MLTLVNALYNHFSGDVQKYFWLFWLEQSPQALYKNINATSFELAQI